MKTETHFELALKICKEQLKTLPLYKKALFTFGCILPDLNPFSYLRGFKIRPFFGHNWENAKSHILHSAEKVEAKGVGLSLGILVHYVCDAFTFSHNGNFLGNISEHTLYEKRLHTLVMQGGSQYFYKESDENLVRLIEAKHRKYEKAPHSLKTDAEFIFAVSGAIVEACLENQSTQILSSRTAER